MSVWPGLMFCLGYAMACTVVAIIAETPRLRTWATCSAVGAVIGGALSVALTLAVTA